MQTYSSLVAHGFFERQAAQTPEAEAVRWGREVLSYRELNERANGLAHRLLEQGLRRGGRAGLAMERSLDLIVALLAVLKTGASYVPLDPAWPAERISYMVADSGCSMVLTDVSGLAARPDNPHIEIIPEDLAYIIYTSGSTGRPKGVAIEHRSAAVFLEWVREAFCAEELSGVLASTSICFDLSIFEILGTLAWGGRLLLCGNVLELGEAPWREQVRLVNTVPSAMRELLALGALPDGVRTVCLAGEAFPEALARQLAGSRRVLNLYGPTEDTTYSTWAEVSGDGPPPIGYPLPGTEAWVLNDAGDLTATGELYLGGAGLARGYVGQPGQTADRFVPDSFSGRPGARLYKTGDRVRLRADGALEYLGRLDEQVKIRGYLVEPGEVARVIESQRGVGECVVTVVAGPGGDPRLAAYFAGSAEADALIAELAALLPEWMMPAALMRIEELPRTPNGKTDRRGLPAPQWRTVAGVEADAPGDEVERGIAEIWRDVLGIERVGIHDDFLALGGHSLLATQAVARIRDRFASNLSLSAFFAHPRIAELASNIRNGPRGAADGTAVVRRNGGTAPLSPAQRHIWFASQLNPADTSYNIPCVVRIGGSPDQTMLQQALRAVMRRQSALRTRIECNGEGAPQQACNGIGEPIPFEDLRSLGGWEECCRRTVAMSEIPLELSRRVFRPALFQLSDTEWALGVVVHHIVFDDWSLSLLVRDFAEACAVIGQGSTLLAPLAVEFGDFCRTQQERDWSAGVNWWREQLRNAPAFLQFPKRSGVAGEGGARYVTTLDGFSMQALEAFALRERATVFMALGSLFALLLGRLTGQNDLLFGTAVAGRNEHRLEAAIGCFINVIPLRARLNDDETCAEMLRRLRMVFVDSLSHQDVPLEKILDDLRPPRAPGRSPLIQAAFGVENGPEPRCTIAGRRFEGTELRPEQARLDLTLWVTMRGGERKAIWTFRKELFTEGEIAQLHAEYIGLLSAAVSHPETRVGRLRPPERARTMSETTSTRKFPGRTGVIKPAAIEPATIDTNWCGRRLPVLVRARAPGQDAAAWARSRRDTIEGHLSGSGGILFRRFETRGIAEFQEFARAIATELLEYGERSSPRTRLADGVYTSTDHPPDQPIVLHNEQSYTLNWPMRILFFCARPAARDGRTPIADSRRILARLSARTVNEFERRGVLYVRNYLPGISLAWSEVFGTNDRREVEKYCASASVECEWLDGERLRTRQMRPAVRTHPLTGERTWFNHALFFHVTSLPLDVSQSLRMAVSDKDLPYNTYYGDGAPIEDATLAELRAAYEAETLSFDWEKGDILVLDNMLIAHGREPFEGAREVRAAMVDPYKRLFGQSAACMAANQESR